MQAPGQGFRRSCIFIVDDCESSRFLLSHVLDQAFPSVEVVAFASAEACLAALAERSPSVVITDYRLPGIDGMELVRRSRPLSASTRFVLSSGFTQLPASARAEETPLDGVLEKPVDRNHLTDLVANLLALAVPEGAERSRSDAGGTLAPSGF